MHGRPTADELVRAVREFLEADVLPATGGALQFQVRVARNVLGIVERELRQGSRADYAEALGRLGFPDEAGLCAAIRAGELDGRTPELVAELLAIARMRVEVAHPGYAEQP
ncbi:DUF6285 domain-containing protein [Fodinicola acaciae]|uniref:DUF6285 domain-containing protein n=1 Tax=Fodinicola acaciae TaxID=2681555 RepID=UPI0013D62FF7|nr:DUF6285 domain-containing protein [Fodinicola acaciae]